MKKKFSKIDSLASALLVAVVTVSALAQAGPDPTPRQKYCPGGTATVNGVAYPYGGKWCDDDQACGFTVNYNVETGEVDSVSPTCLDVA